MIRQNINLFIKVLLIISLVLLFWAISSCAEVEPTTRPVKAKVVEAAPVICVDYNTVSEDEHLDKIQKWEEDHYYATKVWGYLRREGFSQEVTCGIIGNMMIETSGGTLDLKPKIYSPSGNYYGLCQWSKKYYPEAHELSFEQQLEFMLNNIEWEINTFGKCYKEGFKYEDFLTMTDPAEAAIAFAKSYERCGPASYELRKQAALKAYEYFNLERPI